MLSHDDACRSAKRFRLNPDAKEFVPQNITVKDHPVIVHRTINGVGLSGEEEDEENEDYSEDDLIGDLESEVCGSFKPKDTGDEYDGGGRAARAKDIAVSQEKEEATGNIPMP